MILHNKETLRWLCTLDYGGNRFREQDQRLWLMAGLSYAISADPCSIRGARQRRNWRNYQQHVFVQKATLEFWLCDTALWAAGMVYLGIIIIKV